MLPTIENLKRLQEAREMQRRFNAVSGTTGQVTPTDYTFRPETDYIQPTVDPDVLRTQNTFAEILGDPKDSLIAKTGRTLAPAYSNTKDYLNNMSTATYDASNAVETPEYYRNLPTANLPIGDLVIGEGDEALRYMGETGNLPNMQGLLDVAFPIADVLAGTGLAVNLTGKALTSPFAKEIYANIPDAVNRLNKRFTGIDLQPDIMMGQKSKLWNKLGGDSDQFLKNEKAGMDPEENFNRTGTYRGVDGMLRQEIDDSGAKLDYDNLKIVTGNKIGNQLVGDIYKHDLLFEAYPELKDIIISNRRAGNSYAGAFRTGERNNGKEFQELLLNKSYFKSPAMERAISRDSDAVDLMLSPESVTTHEMQHAVQKLEGFDRGSNMGRARSLKNDLSSKAMELKDLKRKFRSNKSFGEYADKTMDNIVSVYDDIKFNTPKENYKKKSGEVEARTVQARRKLSAEDRRKYFPLYESKGIGTIADEYSIKGKDFQPISNRVNYYNMGKIYGDQEQLRQAYGLDYPRDQLYSLKGTGLEGESAFNASYLENTPKKPNELVGTRFTKERVDDLVEPQQIQAKDIEGFSIVSKPSDLSSRGEVITSISDELIPKKYQKKTEGGTEFALDPKNIKQKKYYGSALDQVDRDTQRILRASLENRKLGGEGNVLYGVKSMGENSERFSTMPYEYLEPFFARADKKVIDGLNNQIRTRYPDFSGLNTQEGRHQILMNSNLRKYVMDRAEMKKNQEALGYNAEDLYNALRPSKYIGMKADRMGDLLIPLDKKLLDKAVDMLEFYNIDDLRMSKEAMAGRTKEQNEVLEMIYEMFRTPMGDQHRTYRFANTGATNDRYSLGMMAPQDKFAGRDLMSQIMQGKLDYSIDPMRKYKKQRAGHIGYSDKVTLPEANNILDTGHFGVGLFMDPKRVKAVDELKRSGLFDIEGLL